MKEASLLHTYMYVCMYVCKREASFILILPSLAYFVLSRLNMALLWTKTCTDFI
jgi:hypothetical protein